MLYVQSTSYRKAIYRETTLEETAESMPGKKARVLLICSLALLLYQTKAPLAAAQETAKASPPGLPADRINEILVAIAKMDSRLKVIRTSDFSIESGDLTINVKADKPTIYDGIPYRNGAPLIGLYGQVDVSDKFYGIEMVLHYSILKDRAPYGGAVIQERVTVLYEETPRFKSLHPRAYDSKPFAVSEDGTFVDQQLFGRFHAPLPDNTTQVLKQEFVLNSELVATIYIVRTPKEIRLVCYSVPPLISGITLP